MALPYRISTLLFMQDDSERLLLIKRRKAPNKDCWSPPGGKLDFTTGESPFQCARREALEETGIQLGDEDLHLFGYIAEKSYEGSGHWLMFLFRCLRPVNGLPQTIDEGHFAYFSRAEIDGLPIPHTDRTLLWPYWDSHRHGFVGMRADCSPQCELQLNIEESFSVIQSNRFPGISR